MYSFFLDVHDGGERQKKKKWKKDDKIEILMFCFVNFVKG